MSYWKIAKDAYFAYSLVVDFKNYQGLPMPTWEQLPRAIQQAWIAAVKEARRVN